MIISPPPLTCSEVVSPLAAAVHLVHSDTTQQVCVVGFLQSRHEQLALGNLLWSHVQQLERGLRIRHSSHDALGVLLKKKRLYILLFHFFQIVSYRFYSTKKYCPSKCPLILPIKALASNRGSSMSFFKLFSQWKSFFSFQED